MCKVVSPGPRRSTPGAGAEAGVSLVEVLAAMAILTLVLLPMLDFAAYTYNGQAYERQLAATLAASKLEELQNESYRAPSNIWPFGGGDAEAVGSLVFRRDWTVSQLPNTPPWNPERNWMRQVSVEVWCENCRNQEPITVVTYIAKLNPSAESSKLDDPAE